MSGSSSDSVTEISNCLRKLCIQLSPSKDVAEAAFRMSVASISAAGAGGGPAAGGSEDQLCRRIRERLLQTHSQRQADSFSHYYGLLTTQCHHSMNKRCAILQLFWALSCSPPPPVPAAPAPWTAAPPLPALPPLPAAAARPAAAAPPGGERAAVQGALYAAVGAGGPGGPDAGRAGGAALLAARVAELGFLHHNITRYMDPSSGCMPIGLVGEGLVSAFRNELTEYYRSAAILQSQLNSCDGGTGGALTLRRLCVWALEPIQRLKWLAIIGHAGQHKKGGELVTCVHRFLWHGDPRVTSLVHQLLSTVCYPLYVMLCRWLLDGEIDDPHSEFFIEGRTSVSIERLWHDKYRVRESMRPAFISSEQAQHLLAAGKSVTFLREVCGERGPLAERDHLKKVLDNSSVELLFSDGPQLQGLMASAYLGVSRRLLDAMLGPHKLLAHLAALRAYLLLAQGDFVQLLMTLLEPELNKPASQLYVLNLTCVLESAIRATNAQYHDPDTLNRLYVNLFPPSAEDTGWDVFSLFYRVEGPLGTLLEPDAAARYRSLFSHLWRAKRMEHALAHMWRRHATAARGAARAREAQPLLRRLHALRSEMTHLTKELQYAVFVVVECAWQTLQSDAGRASALDELLTAHRRFLDTLAAGALLDDRTKDLQSYLGNVYAEILTLQEYEGKLYARIAQESDRRKAIETLKAERTARGEYGITAAEEAKNEQDRLLFLQYLAERKVDLKVLARTYAGHVKTFLLKLALQNEANLQFLLFRLDYNDFYKRGDSKLHEPLTYQHKRLSGVGVKSHRYVAPSRTH